MYRERIPDSIRGRVVLFRRQGLSAADTMAKVKAETGWTIRSAMTVTRMMRESKEVSDVDIERLASMPPPSPIQTDGLSHKRIEVKTRIEEARLETAAALLVAVRAVMANRVNTPTAWTLADVKFLAETCWRLGVIPADSGGAERGKPAQQDDGSLAAAQLSDGDSSEEVLVPPGAEDYEGDQASDVEG